jgi:hypothetical protein
LLDQHHPDVIPDTGANGQSDSGMFGGNSNWRGPVWMPVNALVIRALVSPYAFYKNDFTVCFRVARFREGAPVGGRELCLQSEPMSRPTAVRGSRRKKWLLQDHLSTARYDWNGDVLQGRGLFLDMAPWQIYVSSLVKRD